MWCTFFLHFGHVIVQDIKGPDWYFDFLIRLKIAIMPFGGIKKLHAWGFFEKVAGNFLLFGEELIYVPKTHGNYKF